MSRDTTVWCTLATRPHVQEYLVGVDAKWEECLII